VQRISSILLLVVLLALALFYYNRYKVAPKMKFAELELVNTDGEKVNIEQYRGKKIFINFFATWCGPCLREMPELEKAAASLSNDNFVFLCIADAPMEQLKTLSTEYSLVYLQSTTQLKKYGIYTYPTSYLKNEQGKVVYEKIDVEHWSDETVLKKLKELAVQ